MEPLLHRDPGGGALRPSLASLPALFRAVLEDIVEVIRLSLRTGAEKDVNRREHMTDGTALSLATQGGKVEVTMQLIGLNLVFVCWHPNEHLCYGIRGVA